MNAWFKTSSNRKRLLTNSMVGSASSLEHNLPTIVQKAVYNSESSQQKYEEQESDEEHFCKISNSSQEQKMEFTFTNKPQHKQEIQFKWIPKQQTSLNKIRCSFSSSSQRNQEYSNNDPIFTNTSSDNRYLTKMNKQSILRKKEISQKSFYVPIDSFSSHQEKARITFTNTNRSSLNHRKASKTRTGSHRLLTTGRNQQNREHIISLIEYCSNQVGLAIYNVNSAEIHITQIIQRMTYVRTISTIQRFCPQQILYSNTLEKTPLIKKLMKNFVKTSFRPIKRNMFDETKGYYLYSLRGNKQYSNPDHKFVAYAALNALVAYLETSLDMKFSYNVLNIKWHLLSQVLIVQSQTIADLQIFLNSETKKCSNTFIQNFQCITCGGTRMLRANILQPLNDYKMIVLRQNFLKVLIEDKLLADTLTKQLNKMKQFEPITAKFIQSPRSQNIKSIKNYLSAILLLANFCIQMKCIKDRLECFKQVQLIGKLLSLLQSSKVKQLRRIIYDNFNEDILKNYENGNKNKKNFIFLFKVQKLQDDFAEITRVTYSHTVEDILKIFEEIKNKSKHNLKLMHSEVRGYYISTREKVDLNQLSETIQDDILHIITKGNQITFSTSILVSMNNRLKQNQRKLIMQSEQLLIKIIQQIQENIDILFQINYQLSLTDMILAFRNFIKSYPSVHFARPSFMLNDTKQYILKGSRIKSVWTKERMFQISDDIDLTIQKDKSFLVLQKNLNSVMQTNILYSVGYLTILAQIGCYVPASSYQTILFDTILSKIIVEDSIQNNLSHFETQITIAKGITDYLQSQSGKTLLLIDELIRGTQYQQQCALSLSFLNELATLSSQQSTAIILLGDEYTLLLAKQHKRVLIIAIQQEEKMNKSVIQFLQQNFGDQFVEDYQSLQVISQHRIPILFEK